VHCKTVSCLIAPLGLTVGSASPDLAKRLRDCAGGPCWRDLTSGRPYLRPTTGLTHFLTWTLTSVSDPSPSSLSARYAVFVGLEDGSKLVRLSWVVPVLLGATAHDELRAVFASRGGRRLSEGRRDSETATGSQSNNR